MNPEMAGGGPSVGTRRGWVIAGLIAVALTAGGLSAFFFLRQPVTQYAPSDFANVLEKLNDAPVDLDCFGSATAVTCVNNQYNYTFNVAFQRQEGGAAWAVQDLCAYNPNTMQVFREGQNWAALFGGTTIPARDAEELARALESEVYFCP